MQTVVEAPDEPSPFCLSCMHVQCTSTCLVCHIGKEGRQDSLGQLEQTFLRSSFSPSLNCDSGDTREHSSRLGLLRPLCTNAPVGALDPGIGDKQTICNQHARRLYAMLTVQ